MRESEDKLIEDREEREGETETRRERQKRQQSDIRQKTEERTTGEIETVEKEIHKGKT